MMKNAKIYLGEFPKEFDFMNFYNGYPIDPDVFRFLRPPHTCHLTNFLPLLATRDGNCLPSSLSILLVGDNSLADQIRLRGLIFMYENEKLLQLIGKFNQCLEQVPTLHTGRKFMALENSSNH